MPNNIITDMPPRDLLTYMGLAHPPQHHEHVKLWRAVQMNRPIDWDALRADALEFEQRRKTPAT